MKFTTKFDDHRVKIEFSVPTLWVFSFALCAAFSGCNKADQTNAEIKKMNDETKKMREQKVESAKRLLNTLDSLFWSELVEAITDGEAEKIAKAKKQFFDDPKTAAKRLIDLYSAANVADSVELRIAINLAPEFVVSSKDSEYSESIIEPLFFLKISNQPAEIQKLVAKSLEQCIDLAIQHGTKNPMMFVARAQLRFDRKEYEIASDDFRKAINLDSKNESAYIGRSNIHLVNLDFAKAIEDLNRSIEINPENFQTRYLRAICLFEVDELGNALSDVSMSIEQNPKFADSRRLRAKIYQFQGNVEKSKADLQMLQEIENRAQNN